jgi:nucleoside-diphosphate-sugar epimerase
MAEYLISGNKSGLGKYLNDNLPDSLGFGRNELNLFKGEDFNTIIHCAFNKESSITDFPQYLYDNILLTQDLLNLKYQKFVYISTVDVYQKEYNNYSMFKRFAESIVEKNPNALILRCSMMLGYTMKPNHVTKLKDNIDKLSLSGDSAFNYILMDDLVEFFKSKDYLKYSGIIDFTSNNTIKLSEVKEYFNSNTELGNYIYETLNLDFTRNIYTLNDKYNKSSLENLKQYYE